MSLFTKSFQKEKAKIAALSSYPRGYVAPQKTKQDIFSKIRSLELIPLTNYKIKIGKKSVAFCYCLAAFLRLGERWEASLRNVASRGYALV